VPSHVNLKGWKQLRAKVRAAMAEGAKVKVGVLASSGQHESGISMVELAAIHEFGSPAAHIPERSFIRRTFELRRDDIKKQTSRIAVSYLKAKIELSEALGLLGTFVSTAIKNTITSEQVVPRLAESEAGRRTIKRKGSHVTLVDQGQLLNAISWKVEGVTATAESGEGAGEGESGGEE